MTQGVHLRKSEKKRRQKRKGEQSKKDAPMEGTTKSPTTDAVAETGPGRCQTSSCRRKERTWQIGGEGGISMPSMSRQQRVGRTSDKRDEVWFGSRRCR